MNILIMEDEPLLIRVMKKYLSMLGHSVSTALDGKEGLQILKQAQVEFDVIIVDIRMPEVDGLTVIQFILESHPSVPVVCITGHEEKEKTSLFSNIIAVLKKPFDLRELEKTIALVNTN